MVLGICSGRYGFPTEITDDPLLDLVLVAPEGHPNAEERRLLYIALTRAKWRTYLLEERGPRSAFVEELLQAGGRIDTFGLPNADRPHCPECRTGRRMPRTVTEGSQAFYGCSNYPYCEHTQPACPVCKQGLPVRDGETVRCPECRQQVKGCPLCDGWLGRKEGKYGPFLSYSNWPECELKKMRCGEVTPTTMRQDFRRAGTTPPAGSRHDLSSALTTIRSRSACADERRPIDPCGESCAVAVRGNRGLHHTGNRPLGSSAVGILPIPPIGKDYMADCCTRNKDARSSTARRFDVRQAD